MAQIGPKSLAELLSSGPAALQDLAHRAAEHAGLTEALRRGLPPVAGERITMATLESDGTLVVSVDSSAWANRLRYEEATILRLCRAIRPDAKNVRLRVARLSPEPAEPESPGSGS
jgi:hypothetical protein